MCVNERNTSGTVRLQGATESVERGGKKMFKQIGMGGEQCQV